MLVKTLGAIDLIVGLIILFLTSLNLPNQMLLFFGVLIFTKSSIGMLRDFGSWIDFSAGIILGIAILVNIPLFLSLVVGFLVLQKGVFSFF